MRGYKNFGELPSAHFVVSGLWILVCGLSALTGDLVFLAPLLVELVFGATLIGFAVSDRSVAVPPAQGPELARISVAARIGGFYLAGFLLLIWALRYEWTWGVVLGAVLLPLGLWTGRPRRGVRISADQAGLTVIRAGRVLTADWTQARTLGPGGIGGSDWKVRIPFVAAKDGMEFAQRIGPFIRDARFATVLEHTAREPYDFGTVTLMPEGMKHNGKVIPWREISGATTDGKANVEVRTISGTRKVFGPHDPELLVAVTQSRASAANPPVRYADPSYPQPTFGVPHQSSPADVEPREPSI